MLIYNKQDKYNCINNVRVSYISLARNTKQYYGFVLCLILLFFGTVCSQSSLRRPVHIGFIRAQISQLTLQLLEKEGFLGKMGLTRVQWHNYSSESELFEAFQNNKLDVGCGEFLAVLDKILNQTIEASLLAPVSLHGYGLIVRRTNTPIDTNNLVGKKIAIIDQPSMEDFLLKQFILQYNLPSNGITIVRSQLSEVSQQLMTGEIDGIMLREPECSKLLNNDKTNLFLLSEKILPDHPHSVIFVSKQLIQNRREVLDPLLLALFEVSDLIIRNKHILTSNQLHFPIENEIRYKAISRFIFTAKYPIQYKQEMLNYISQFHKMRKNMPRGDLLILKQDFLRANQNYISQKEAYYRSLKKTP